jgi:L-fuconolactonase
MKVDAHHHLWDPAARDYPWMTGEAAALARRYDVDDLRQAIATTPVELTVLVQTVTALAETKQFLATAAASGATIAGVVGWIDLGAPDVSETLGQLMAGENGHLLVGVRHQVHDEPDPRWLQRDDVRRGLRAVRDVGLVFDLLVKPRELPAAIALVHELHDQRFVLDHIGKPPIAEGVAEPWASLTRDLAAHENVSCKLSGLVTEAAKDWTVADLAPYVQHVFDVFGPDRVMFGSDWPVSTLRAPYRVVYDTAVELTASLSAAERDLVFGDNAVKTYGLL